MTNIELNELNFDENTNLWISWQDEASGGLNISQITIKPAKWCKDCCETVTIDIDGQWEECSCDDCDCEFECTEATCEQSNKFFQVEYPGRGGSHEIEIELDDDLLTELRNVSDAAWPEGDQLFIAEV